MRAYNFILSAILVLLSASLVFSESVRLHREVAPKLSYTTLPPHLDTNTIIIKIREEFDLPGIAEGKFDSHDPAWDAFNRIIVHTSHSRTIAPHFDSNAKELRNLQKQAASRSGELMPDLTKYIEMTVSGFGTNRASLLDSINKLETVELAYFPAVPVLAGELQAATPNFQGSQFYLNSAPDGVDAYYAWGFAGGRGENVKVIDIEGNWVEHHEDLRGGASSFHIAGSKIADPTWYHHGTAVLGEIASDSNVIGTTGIAYNVDLGTVSIGSMSIANAIATAAANSDTGDVILIELQISGPNAGAYVPVEYEQATFDAILLASSSGRIVVEAGANGGQDLDNTSLYGQLFNPAFRFSGAIMVGAANPQHVPEGFSSYGQRVDVHAYGEQVVTLGYGDLYGTDTLNYYTNSFSGTSSASPIVTASCAVLQGIHKNLYAKVLDHAEMRALLINHGTPQFPSVRQIGPMPNLKGSVDEVVGVSFFADTTVGWVPFPVSFSGNSGLSVDTWKWTFGDGDSAATQDIMHVYDSAGVYDVQLQITAGAEVRTSSRLDYIVALADSLQPADVSGAPGDTVEVTISITNTIPLRTIVVPVAYSGSMHGSVVGFSFTGCRTDYFQVKSLIAWDTADFTYRLRSSNNGTAADLPPGSGPIMKVLFAVPDTATATDTQFIDVQGYSSHLPAFTGLLAEYAPQSFTSAITVCERRGDVNASGAINIVDLTYLVQYLFAGGVPPVPINSGDVNCSATTNIVDLTFLVQYLFQGGPPPCSGC